MKPLRVLLISHTCQALLEGQPKAHCIAQAPDVELCVWVPDRWKRYGAWRQAQAPTEANFEFRIERVSWPWSGPGQTYLHWYRALPRLMREWKPDVIDVWEEPWSLVAAQTCFWRDRLVPHCKIVAETEQNIDKALPPPFGLFRKYVFQGADFVVGRSDETLQIARRRGFSGPTRVVPNAVDTALFAPDGPICRHFKGETDFVLGYVGRLVQSKGIADLLGALALCPPEVKLLIVGGGPDEAEFRALSLDLGLEDRVHFEGMRPVHELPPLLRAMNALVLPSRTGARWKEQFGRVLIEAGACGVPVIGSSSGAIPGVVGSSEGAMGLIFPEGNSQALASAIEMLRGNRGLARKLGQNGVLRAHAGVCVAKSRRADGRNLSRNRGEFVSIRRRCDKNGEICRPLCRGGSLV